MDDQHAQDHAHNQGTTAPHTNKARPRRQGEIDLTVLQVQREVIAQSPGEKRIFDREDQA